MATISIGSDKGGPGKTTTAILVGTELALDGYTVGIIDTDLNQQDSHLCEQGVPPRTFCVPRRP